MLLLIIIYTISFTLELVKGAELASTREELLVLQHIKKDSPDLLLHFRPEEKQANYVKMGFLCSLKRGAVSPPARTRGM